MEITLKNIGIIENSTIKIDGLTVIAGYNNSGKTTIGKVAYSIFEAISKIDEKMLCDKNKFISKELKDFQNYLFQLQKNIIDNSKLIEKNKLSVFSSQAKFFERIYEHIKNNTISEIDTAELDALTDESDLFPDLFNNNNLLINDIKVLSVITKCIANIGKLLILTKDILSHIDIKNKRNAYIKQSIKHTLLTVFSNQITPYKKLTVQSSIIISENKNEFYKINIKSNQITSIPTINDITTNFDNILFIDDPFILDEPLDKTNKNVYLEKNLSADDTEETILVDTERFKSHRKQLLSILKTTDTTTIYEELINLEKYQNITKKINDIIPGSFDFSGEDDLYIEDGFELKFSNLATGSKLFAILKILIEKNKIDDNTLLILDEPEAHLHPEWQLTLAELLTVFVKEIGVKIILTTHSPNFLLAIETYMLKYQTEKQTNYYITEENENKFVNYRLVNDNMDLLYSKFANPFFDLQNLKDSLL